MNLLVFTSLASSFLFALFYDCRLLALQASIVALYFLGAWSYRGRSKTSLRRKIAMSSWGEPSDPTCFGTVEVNCEKVDSYLEKYNQANPEAKVTYTHYFLKALGVIFRDVKGINGKIVFGNFIPYDSVSVNTLVNIDDKNLAGVLVKNCDSLNIGELRSQVNAGVKKLKTKKDENFKEQMNIAKMLSSFFMSVLLHVSSFISYELEMDVKPLKIKKNAFGNILLTNVSKMNSRNTFAPLISWSKTMCVLVLNRPFMKAVVNEEGEIVPRKIMNVNISFDHRYADGAQGSLIVKKLNEIVDNPTQFME